MKKFVAIFLGIMGLQASVNAQELPPCEECPPEVEIYNKSRHPIWVDWVNAGEPDVYRQARSYVIDNDAAESQDIDTSQKTFLAVWFANPGDFEVNLNAEDPTKIWSKKPAKIYTFTPDKTIFISWDRGDYPRPQTGPLKGILGKTKTGYSLKRNVDRIDIKEVTAQEEPSQHPVEAYGAEENVTTSHQAY